MQEVHILTSRMLTQRKQLNMIADNMANLNTNGYKKLDIQFEEVLSRHQGQKVGSYVADNAITVDFKGGPITKTDNPFDMAIIGEGFFAVNANGRTEYTRNGNFLLNNTSTIVDSRGNPLMDNAGAPIAIPEGSTNITIARDGTIANQDGIIAQIGVYSFDRQDMQKLQRTGFGGFVPLPGVTANLLDDTTSVLQGSIESSNVDPAMEVVNMQELSRQYQSAANLMKKIEDLESAAIQKIGGSQ